MVFGPDARVLVLRHKNGDWVFPKGHLEPGESALEAARREVEEEAGVRADALTPLVREVTRYHNARGEFREIAWFLLSTPERAPVLREALFPEGAFLEPAEALACLSFAEDRHLLGRMLEHYLARSEVGA